MKIYLFIGLTLSFNIAVAQYIEDYPANKKNGELMIETKNWPEAIRIYHELVEKDPENTKLRYFLGKAYAYADVDKRRSLSYLTELEAFEDKEDDFYESLAISYFFNYKFDEAKNVFRKIADSVSNPTKKTEFNTWALQCDISKKMMNSPIPVEFENLGENINSKAPDFLPIVTPDEGIIVYTTRRKGVVGNLNSYAGYKSSDIYTARHKRNKYSKGRSVGSPNTYGDEFTAGRSDNGKYLTYTVNSEDYYNDIFIAEKGRRSFMPPKSLHSDEIDGKPNELGSTLSNDGKILYFSSDRDGGMGGFDLWYVQRLPNGEWSEVRNLGSPINTKKDEKYPILADDETTLYFSSNGFEGMGGMDIYVAKAYTKPNTWQEPKNLGYPINTPFDDLNISFAENRRYAYMAKRLDDTFGDLDIYRLTFLGEKDNHTAINGRVMNIDSTALVNRKIKIEVFYLNSGTFVGSYIVNERNGKYAAVLSPGQYTIEVKGVEGFKNYSQNIRVLGKNEYSQIRKFDLLLESK